ncbi:MAG: hypothetical protein WA265_03110, partial [Rhodomicrobium sp.]
CFAEFSPDYDPGLAMTVQDTKPRLPFLIHSPRSGMKTKKTICFLLVSSAALAVIAATPALAICTAQGLDLMRNLNGAWRGKGAVTPIGGSPEFVSCHISYAMAAADVINQVIMCAGTDYKLEASSQVTCDGNKLEGWFEDRTAHLTGRVSGDISGNYLLIEADSAGFKGNFRVTFKNENDHLVSITQADHATGRQVPVASIKLTR